MKKGGGEKKGRSFIQSLSWRASLITTTNTWSGEIARFPPREGRQDDSTSPSKTLKLRRRPIPASKVERKREETCRGVWKKRDSFCPRQSAGCNGNKKGNSGEVKSERGTRQGGYSEVHTTLSIDMREKRSGQGQVSGEGEKGGAGSWGELLDEGACPQKIGKQHVARKCASKTKTGDGKLSTGRGWGPKRFCISFSL